MAPQALETHGSGVYVGELMAYFSASAAFCQLTSQLYIEHESALTAFVGQLQSNPGVKPTVENLEIIASQVGIPIVLEIVLDEDCEVSADTHFEVVDNAAKSWKLWRSVLLNREQGIPAHWIKKFYFPRLLDYRDLATVKNPRLLEQTIDSSLMVGGMMQSWHKDTPGDLLLAFKKQYGKTNFSQSMNFDEASVERFFNLNGMLDAATRLLNQMTIWQDIDALAKKQGIPLQ
ncbi:hypothetical protein [Undibacterium sp. Di24W]|uniref:hypothetical protein n=1 Tax=Undibacterium sp. Di24W TaxID=3413033 RepID=UPI003BEFCB7A